MSFQRSQEELNEIRIKYSNGKLLESMVGHAGWSEVLRPHLQTKRAALLEQLATVVPEHVLALQIAVKNIDDLFAVIDNAISEGKQAFELIRNEDLQEL